VDCAGLFQAVDCSLLSVDPKIISWSACGLLHNPPAVHGTGRSQNAVALKARKKKMSIGALTII
jgi:hypothetical protein